MCHASEDLENICVNFYSNLYTKETLTPSIETNREYILSYVSSRLSPKMDRELETPLSKDELQRALKQMALGRSPGSDGVTLEFFSISGTC